MRILMISTDRKIFEENSLVWQRMFNYGTIVDELHIIVLSRVLKDSPIRKNIKVSEKVFVYPTNSKTKFHYILMLLESLKIQEILI